MTTIRVFDTETTGMEPPEAEVCEVGIADMRQEVDESWRIFWTSSWLCRVKSMPPEVRAIHHITMDDVKNCDPFYPDGILLGVDVIAAHNYSFDSKFLGKHDVPAICTYKAALRMWPESPSHSNGVLRYWLQDQGLIPELGDDAQPAHRAGPDAYVTAHILKALLERATVEEMVEWTKLPACLPRCPIGKFRGFTWDKVEWGFLSWMTQQASMENDLKWNAQREINRRAAK